MWCFDLPTTVTFGPGAVSELAGVVAGLGRRPLLVTDAALLALSPLARVRDALGETPVFSDVRPNPTVANVDALAGAIRAHGADVLVAVGGGSSMDCAKAAGALVRSNYASIRAVHSQKQPLPDSGVPLVAVPTTAGTGSEVTPFAVLDDTEKQVKGPIAGACLYPAAAVVDPELTHTLPLGVTAATGLDALAHALEGYWSRNHQPICDLLATEAGRLIFANLATVCTAPGNAPARERMSYAALLAGMAFQLPKNAMVHACSFPLSNRYHLSHGAACAFTLEFAIRHNAPAMGGRLEAFAAACGLADLEAMIAAIAHLKALGGLPRTLAEAGIPRDAVPTLVAESFHPLMNNNPAPVSAADLERMYAEL